MKNTGDYKESTPTTTSQSQTENSEMPFRKLTRSQSITTSSIPTNCVLPPDVENQWRKRRESLDNLNVDKVAPWMHLHDFSESEAAVRRNSGSGTSP